jgi:peptidoglycan/LPS O-acetylase OafA/YrhL
MKRRLRGLRYVLGVLCCLAAAVSVLAGGAMAEWAQLVWFIATAIWILNGAWWEATSRRWQARFWESDECVHQLTDQLIEETLRTPPD